ncbi:hypothetical protein Aph01nite_68160 [Acrocarpospora phusangensis]|uniref:Uncharacterized protein n=1 Tax=Acrocarpospora phusangensis TaxID=1070424 RepID=A0A919QIK2_9ACTN|nr:hypothetical protein [Acrocarpospora phusangensis]GIH28506.1 hypothetical protein Aph01nite_68160 [Acrocarpospora phusangensis]
MNNSEPAELDELPEIEPKRWQCCHCGGTGSDSYGDTCRHCDGLGNC